MALSKPTAEFLLGVLSGLTLDVGASDFDDAAMAIVTAKKELAEIVGEDRG